MSFGLLSSLRHSSNVVGRSKVDEYAWLLDEDHSDFTLFKRTYMLYMLKC